MDNGEDDRKCSHKKMGGNDGWRTVECLRGRLLAERQVSKIAKEEAECMGNKLIELENMLKEAIKLRNKAEKKLKKLKMKVQTLNISSILVESEQSSSSGKSEVSCRSSTVTSSSTTGSCDSEENESNCQLTNSVISQESSRNVSVSETSTAKNNHEITIVENPIGHSAVPSSFEDLCDNPSQKSEDSNTHDTSSSGLQSSTAENGIDHEDYVDNSLALVPVSSPVSVAPKTIDLKPVHENVAEVLDSLRYIREKIQSSVEIRRMVRVGPT
ncbi:hypothetical protein PanWU01x14_062620 [Parasponia andersonii]|uniref:Uncharacterized protein n=1 Tax=Parasponia andersonii TaxID=3476 RepID=A0A2P5DHQ8_PARAD|nr:hypothetical protein PanWU01x14_062620 [Parasponia andersonii]